MRHLGLESPCTHSTCGHKQFAVNRQTLHVLKWAQSGYHPLSLKSNATFRCTSPSPLFGARLACSTRLQAATGRSGAASGLICIRPYQPEAN
nr:hypothetical protein [uncultured bacterium]